MYKMFFILALYLILSSAAYPTASLADIAPEPDSGFHSQPVIKGQEYMVVTAHKLASKAAVSMLNSGGSALDAAIAAQLVLNVVEPQSSGIGGGGFMLYYDAKHDQLTSFDGRETAPARATPNMFLDKKSRPMPFMMAVRNPRSIGTPGLVSLMSMTHKRYGKLPWHTLFEPAITIAQHGFLVSPRLHKSISYALDSSVSESFQKLYANETYKAKPTGSLITNPALAKSLAMLANIGPGSFYQGPIADNIISKLTPLGGILSKNDFLNYEAIERTPVCGEYRKYKICSMGLPSSGGITLLQTLGILSNFSLSKPYNANDIHLILEAEKRAFADRNYYLADRDFTSVPSNDSLLSADYLKLRSSSITRSHATDTPSLPGKLSLTNGQDNSFDAPSTTHISIVDSSGNAVSLTSSVEHSFGSGIIVDGFVLNNQLTDFAFTPIVDGNTIANAVAPGKRPRSSMTPTIIFSPTGKLFAVLGSPGGSSIIPYVRKIIIDLIDWKLNLHDALHSPHFMHKNDVVQLENGQEDLASILKHMGHDVILKSHSSGIHAIIINDNGILVGGADPRREGIAIGK